jgi:hypothetical protein
VVEVARRPNPPPSRNLGLGQGITGTVVCAKGKWVGDRWGRVGNKQRLKASIVGMLCDGLVKKIREALVSKLIIHPPGPPPPQSQSTATLGEPFGLSHPAGATMTCGPHRRHLGEPPGLGITARALKLHSENAFRQTLDQRRAAHYLPTNTVRAYVWRSRYTPLKWLIAAAEFAAFCSWVWHNNLWAEYFAHTEHFACCECRRKCKVFFQYVAKTLMNVERLECPSWETKPVRAIV